MTMEIPEASATLRSAAGSLPISSRVRSTSVLPPAARSARSSWQASCSSLSRPLPRYSLTRSMKTCSCGSTTPSCCASTGPVTVITSIWLLCGSDRKDGIDLPVPHRPARHAAAVAAADVLALAVRAVGRPAAAPGLAPARIVPRHRMGWPRAVPHARRDAGRPRTAMGVQILRDECQDLRPRPGGTDRHLVLLTRRGQDRRGGGRESHLEAAVLLVADAA